MAIKILSYGDKNRVMPVSTRTAAYRSMTNLMWWIVSLYYRHDR